jgi:hypothetical protein
MRAGRSRLWLPFASVLLSLLFSVRALAVAAQPDASAQASTKPDDAALAPPAPSAPEASDKSGEPWLSPAESDYRPPSTSPSGTGASAKPVDSSPPASSGASGQLPQPPATAGPEEGQRSTDATQAPEQIRALPTPVAETPAADSGARDIEKSRAPGPEAKRAFKEASDGSKSSAGLDGSVEKHMSLALGARLMWVPADSQVGPAYELALLSGQRFADGTEVGGGGVLSLIPGVASGVGAAGRLLVSPRVRADLSADIGGDLGLVLWPGNGSTLRSPTVAIEVSMFGGLSYRLGPTRCFVRVVSLSWYRNLITPPYPSRIVLGSAIGIGL